MKRFAKFHIRIPAALVVGLLISSFADAQMAEPITPKANQGAAVQAARLELKNARQRVAREAARVAEHEATTEGLRGKLLTQSKKEKGLGISPESYPEIVRHLQTQRVELMIDLAGLDAKRELLTEAMQETSRLLDVRQRHQVLNEDYERLEKLAETRGEGVEAKLAEAKAKLKQWKSKHKILELDWQARGTLEQELFLDLSLQKAEQTARLEQVEKLLTSFATAGETLLAREQLTRRIGVHEEQLTMLRSNLFKREADVDAARDRLEQLEPAKESPDEF